MIIPRKRTSFFVFFMALFLGVQQSAHTNPMHTPIKAILVGKPFLISTDRASVVGEAGVFSTLWNLGKALSLQKDLFAKITKKFGAQTQPYKANDPDTGKPLPLIMRYWLTGEKTGVEVRDAILKLFDGDSYTQKIVNIVFTPEKFIATNGIINDALKLVKRVKPGISQFFASNQDAATYEAIRTSDMGKKILPHFKAVYNSGNLKPPHQGIVLQDPAFYQLIMQEQNLKPEECLVIDTDEDIIAAAKSLGMQHFQYKAGDYDAVKKELKRLHLIS
jgi:phosphoglycolate phosphatase-like HAD superfamily hydrolase